MKFLPPLFALLAFHFIADCNGGGGFHGGFHQGRAFPVAFAPKAKKSTSTKTAKASSTSGRISAAFRSKIRADRCKWTPKRSGGTSGTGVGTGIGTKEGTGVTWTEPENRIIENSTHTHQHKTEFGASAFGSSAGLGSETKRLDNNNNDSNHAIGGHGSGIIKNGDAQVQAQPKLGPSQSRRSGNFGIAGTETTKPGHRQEMNGATEALLDRAIERNRRAKQKLELVAKSSRNDDGNTSSDTVSHKGKSATAAETTAKKSGFRGLLSSKSNAGNSDKKNPYGQAGDYTAEQVAKWVENDKEAKKAMYLAHLEQTYEEMKKKNATSRSLGTIFEGEREGREDDDDGSHEAAAAAAKASPLQSETSAESAEMTTSTSSGTSDGDVGGDIVSPPTIEDDDDVGPIPSSLKPPASLKESAAPVFYQDKISAAGVEGGNSNNLDNNRAVSFVDEDIVSDDHSTNH